MQTIRHIDTIDIETISTRVIVAHAELNAQCVSDLPREFACGSTFQEEVSAPACFSSRSADGDDHRVRTIGADPLLPEPKELPCRFVKQSSQRSLQPSSWSPASPQATRGIAITITVIITTAITIMVITTMAIIITGIMAGTTTAAITIITAIIITTVTTTTVITTTNEEEPADAVGRLTTSVGSPSIHALHAFGNRTSGE